MPGSDFALGGRLRALGAELCRAYPGKDEVVRLLLVCLLAGESCLLVGPPGTAKSALVRSLAERLDASYFEYLLTRSTEPSELLGPVDFTAYRGGSYRRSTEGMLPSAELVFLDELGNAGSTVLNALLGLLNDRSLRVGPEAVHCQALAVFAAANELPAEREHAAVLDRFPLRVRTADVAAHDLSRLLRSDPAERMAPATPHPIAVEELRAAAAYVRTRRALPEELLETYRDVVVGLRAEGMSFSDRRALAYLRLFAASALLDERAAPDVSDLDLLRYASAHPDDAELLDGVLQPLLRERRRPRSWSLTAADSADDLGGLAAEFERLRGALLSSPAPAGAALLSYLKQLGELRTALVAAPSPAARSLEAQVAAVLDSVLRSERFGQP